MSRSRHILAVVTVATALCAQRTVSTAAALPRPAAAGMAARLVDRLSQPFRRTTPGDVRIVVSRRTGPDVPAPRQRKQAPRIARAAQRALSPFQFRLPPPTL